MLWAGWWGFVEGGGGVWGGGGDQAESPEGVSQRPLLFSVCARWDNREEPQPGAGIQARACLQTTNDYGLGGAEGGYLRPRRVARADGKVAG